ncbi:helix-turn-helix domain-containing protein, partial [Thiolapillus sp.]|uniref:helix-turn-helix domain-containing protein n=1 Tax=Thiolapillus sp. TaxID=2017437 RepID=UPI003AF661D1
MGLLDDGRPLNQGKSHKIKALYDQGNGLTIRAIARQLGISRNTVRKDETAIAEQQESRVRHRQLDDHRDYIISLLGQFPDLSAVKVLRKLKQKHPALAVSDRTARRYIRDLKETVTLRQRRYYEPIESLPGVQCQVDGGELRGVRIGAVETTAHFVVFVLSYSRLMYVGVADHPIDTATFIRLHDAA